MKRLLPAVWLCCVAGAARAQAPASFPVDKATRRICYAAVEPVAGASQAELLARARGWASGLATLEKPFTVNNEQGTDVLVALGSQPYSYTYILAGTATARPRRHTEKLVLHYTAKLSLRESRYRYEVTDFVFEYPAAKRPSPTRLPAEAELIETFAINADGATRLAAFRKRFREDAAKLLEELKAGMSKATATPDAVR